MKFKDMPYKRVDYDKTAEQFKTLTKRVKEAKSGEELWDCLLYTSPSPRD